MQVLLPQLSSYTEFTVSSHVPSASGLTAAHRGRLRSARHMWHTQTHKGIRLLIHTKVKEHMADVLLFIPGFFLCNIVFITICNLSLAVRLLTICSSVLCSSITHNYLHYSLTRRQHSVNGTSTCNQMLTFPS